MQKPTFNEASNRNPAVEPYYCWPLRQAASSKNATGTKKALTTNQEQLSNESATLRGLQYWSFWSRKRKLYLVDGVAGFEEQIRVWAWNVQRSEGHVLQTVSSSVFVYNASGSWLTAVRNVWIYIYIYVICVCVHVCAHIDIHICAYIYIQMCTYMFIYIYTSPLMYPRFVLELSGIVVLSLQLFPISTIFGHMWSTRKY